MANGVVERGKDDYSSASGSESDDNNENQPHKNGTSSVSVNANSDVRDNSGYLNSVARQNSGGHFGDVNITNSTDILVGNKAYLNGDVTINQYIYPKGIEEENPITDHLPIPKDITIKTDKGNFKLQNGNKTHPILHITQQQSVSEKGFVREWWRWMSCAFAGALLVLSTLLFLLWVIGAIRPRDDGTTNEPTPAPPKQYPFVIPENLTDEDKKFLEETAYRFVTRTEWAAQPTKELTPQITPVKRVIVTHSATDSCFSRLECISSVKLIQDFHMDSRNWSDIAYNFLVSGNGDIFIGRGWDNYGAHTKGYNIGSVSVAFIGTFTNLLPADEQVSAAKILIETGLIIDKISEDYDLYAHRQLISTDSPGTNVYNIIKEWPHWKKT